MDRILVVIPLTAAQLFVDMADEAGELTPGEAETVAIVRDRIDEAIHNQPGRS